MATLLVPVTTAAAYGQQKTRLDGRDYILRLAYNERLDRWFLSIFDDQEEPLVMGIRLVANWPLLRHYHWDERVPPGELMAMSLTTDVTPPGFADLGEGRRVELTYFEAETTT